MKSQIYSYASQYLSDRRQFVLGAGSLAIIPYLADLSLGQTPAKPKFASDPFQLGVASGDPQPDGFVIWTRLDPNPLEQESLPPVNFPVTWEISDDHTFAKVIKQGRTLATPQLGHSVHVEVHGLKPNRWYWYRFRSGDAVSHEGRARTTPRFGQMVDQLNFAVCSCQNYEQGLFTAYQHMVLEELDLVVHLGDYIYEYEGQENRVRKHLGKEVESIEEYRLRLSQYRSDKHLQGAHARCPWLVVWDDHEFDNNYANDISEEDGIDYQKFMLRRANAYQAYYEMMPLRRRNIPKGPHMQLYRRVPFGQLANFQMLDTRQYRTDQPNGDGNKPLNEAELDPRGTLLGEKQENWLMRDLIASQSNWNILGQQVMMGRVDRVPGEEAKYSMDQWPGYGPARDRLLRFIDERRVPNPVVLTGDIHSNWVNNLPLDALDDDSPVVATEFVATSISSGGNGNEAADHEKQLKAENRGVQYFNAQRGYISCRVTPDVWQSDYQVVDYVDRPGAPLVTKASFVIESGKPGATLDSRDS